MITKFISAYTALLMSLLAVLASPGAAASSNDLKFGSVAMDIPAVMYSRLHPLIQYLSGALGQPVSLRLAPNMKDAIQDISSGTVDLAYLTPVAYLRAHAQGGAKLLVKTVTDGRGSFQLMIIVKDNSPIKTIDDLKGKTFAFGDRSAYLQRATVVNAGIKLKEFKDYQFIGHYDNIVRAVIHGDFDAGIVKDTMAYKWRGNGIRVLYASPAFPPYNISVSRNVGPQLYTKLENLFLELNDGKPNHLVVVHALDKNYSGFAQTSDAEYDIVRKLIAQF